MSLELVNGFGQVYLTIAYDPANQWVYNNWIGYQTYIGIISGADACLHPLRDNHCPYLLNDNRQVIGPWNHAVDWLTQDWIPRAIKQGLTHFAHVVSPDSLAANSAEAMQASIGEELPLRLFSDIEEAQAWLRQAQEHD